MVLLFFVGVFFVNHMTVLFSLREGKAKGKDKASKGTGKGKEKKGEGEKEKGEEGGTRGEKRKVIRKAEQ